jgi:hypothetical protein
MSIDSPRNLTVFRPRYGIDSNMIVFGHGYAFFASRQLNISVGLGFSSRYSMYPSSASQC